ncbi:phage tail length tape measure family protein [Brucella sp. 6810]|uniref:phage tail length tape measure family protein n=1 Tax=Brucella sp. 6810 TaxID=2769351 RepID=UPI00165B3371|nr:phage tail length tape measure family protein [Brucella sp. 6810]QNQ62427.1 phage tail length tape measure family protein [Brucella sp. 6810]
MSDTFAALGFKTYSKPLADATNELNRLSAAAKKAESANDNLSKSAEKAASGAKKAAKDAKEYADAIKGSSFQTANLASQFNDIGVMLAAGQSPLQLALQQGTQISQVLNTMGSGTDVLRGLASAFMSIVNPVSLMTVGMIAAGAALVQYVTGVGRDIKSADEVLKGHEALIREVRDAYGDAAVAVEQYAGKSKLLLEYDIKRKIDEYRAIVNESAENLYTNINSIASSKYEGATYIIGEVRGALNLLQDSIRRGDPDVRRFVDRLIEIRDMSGTPEEIRRLIDAQIELGRTSGDTQGKLASLSNIIENLGDYASNQVEKINDLTKAYRDLASIAAPTLSNMEKAKDAYNRAVTADGSIENRIKAAKEYQATLARLRASEMPVPGQRPNLESIAPEKAKSGRSDAEREADRQAKAISRVTENLQFELDTMGMSTQSLRLQNALRQANADIYSAEGQKIADLVEKINAKEAATKAAAEADKQAKEAQEKFVHAMDAGLNMIGDTILSIADGSDKASDAVKRLAVELALAAAQAALFGSGPLAGLFGGGSFGGGFKSAQLAGTLASGGIGLFANGGVTNKPAIFGEAGPEAAVPLPDGRHIPVKMMGGSRRRSAKRQRHDRRKDFLRQRREPPCGSR